MSNSVVVQSRNSLPANVQEEADALLAATQVHEKLLKFKKGKFFVMDDEVALGTEFICHALQLTLGWVKFVANKVAERKMGRAADRFVPAERDELGDLDKSEWEYRDGEAVDPWSYQHLLPLEHIETGEVYIFTTSSIGGKIATEVVVQEYAKRLKRTGARALPIIRLGVTEMKSKKYGDVKRPHFEITGWENETPVSPSRACLARERVVAAARDITPPHQEEPKFGDAEIEAMQADVLRHADKDLPF